MIEQSIYFALGCIVTALLALLFAPVFWRRALRLTRQRLALQVPLSMQEILAERDQIRAEFAVERLRLEQAMDAVQATKAMDMAEIGRRSMEAAKCREAATSFGEEAAVLRQSEQALKADIERLQREIAEANASLAASSPVEPSDDRRRAEVALAQNDRLQFELDSLRATVAALKTRGMGLEARLLDAERGAGSKDSEASLRTRLETAMAHVARHEAASLSVRRELDEAKTLIRRLEQDLDAARLAPHDAASHRAEASSPGAEKLDLLAAENAALRGALAAVRRESGAGGDADADLRETIHALGLAVAKLTRAARETGTASTALPNLPVKKPAGLPVGVA